MESLIELTGIPIITAIVFVVINIIKIAVKSNEIYLRITPLIALILGIGLGVLGYYLTPMIILADNIMTAILIGGVSGLSATGCHQVFKQLAKSPIAKLILPKVLLGSDGEIAIDITNEDESKDKGSSIENGDAEPENDTPETIDDSEDN